MNDLIKFLEGFKSSMERHVNFLKMNEEINQVMFKYGTIPWEVAQTSGIEYSEAISAGEEIVSLTQRIITSLQAKKPWGEPDFEKMEEVPSLFQEMYKKCNAFTSKSKSSADRNRKALESYEEGELDQLTELSVKALNIGL